MEEIDKFFFDVVCCSDNGSLHTSPCLIGSVKICEFAIIWFGKALGLVSPKLSEFLFPVYTTWAHLLAI